MRVAALEHSAFGKTHCTEQADFGRNHSHSNEHVAYAIWEGKGTDDRKGGADAVRAPDVVDFLGAPHNEEETPEEAVGSGVLRSGVDPRLRSD